MANYTSSLPSETLEKLSDMAELLKVPKNKIIERAVNKYLSEIERQLYIKSFKKIAGDEDMIALAEAGMKDYLIDLDDWDEKK